jgi:imidazole glycerol-phosphate synthase subunit HisH
MSSQVVLIDHGVGNLRSVEKALAAAGAAVAVSDDPFRVREAEKLVLPGVGAFADAMNGLSRRGLEVPLLDAVQGGVPLLGICVGMQMLFDGSEEHGEHPGLGLLQGRVVPFQSQTLTIPQTGWNQIFPTRETPLLAGLEAGSYAYFNHTYYCRPESQIDWLAATEYGTRYSSMVGKENLFGVQFHPEKSQRVGLQILENFIKYC